MENVIITGSSRGIGNALARLMLQKGHRVFGISRSAPENCVRRENYHHCSVDLADTAGATERLTDFLFRRHGLRRVERLFLNAGLFGERIAPANAVAFSEMEYVMKVNVWANKLLLDLLLERGVGIDTCIVSSSIAGVRARSGFSSYAVSKAALNMMMKIYAMENPATFFAVLGLCFVDTQLSRHILHARLEGDFPEIMALRERAKGHGYLATAEQRAMDIEAMAAAGMRNFMTSGDFIEIRSLLKMMNESELKAV